MTDSARLEQYLNEKHSDFESKCLRCGLCCGAGDDPCENLSRQSDGTYICRVYGTHHGPQRTISGSVFTCVPITEHIRFGTLREGCGYRDKNVKM
ncbi:MAG TPA: hypothetical protein PKY78_08810 [Candidatus Omnitrophota bacterium]|nr:hypothetical protein [Candidatus Omnitrophota bacterium]